MPELVGAVEKAIEDGQISKEQVNTIIAYLACYEKGLLNPGGKACNSARLAFMILPTDQESIFPSGTGKIPPVCQTCPVFAPALNALAKRLPQ